MTNNKLCDILGAAGCIMAAASMVLIFFGASCCWVGAIVGVGLALLAQCEYEN